MKVVEAVARAIALADGFSTSEAPVMVGFVTVPAWKSRIKHAEAAIAAYRAAMAETPK